MDKQKVNYSTVAAIVSDDPTAGQWTKLLSYYGEDVKVSTFEVYENIDADIFAVGVSLDHLKFNDEVFDAIKSLPIPTGEDAERVLVTDDTGFSILVLDWTKETLAE